MYNIDSVRNELRMVAKKRKPQHANLQQVVSFLYPEIDTLYKVGTPMREIAEALCRRGIKISMGTLQNYYIAESKKQKLEGVKS
jgi:hypothetical protein